MPNLDDPAAAGDHRNHEDSIPFAPVTKEHILHCSYDYWFPKYRASCIRSRIIPLSPEFMEYLDEDGIILADDDEPQDKEEEEEWEPTVASAAWAGNNGHQRSDSDSEEDEQLPARLPPNQRFPALHQTINNKIAELGGAVCPKLNWSAPKDAAWISPHQNTLKCTTPNDIYLLLKSSSFISHDLQHAFDGCAPSPSGPTSTSPSFASTAPPGRRFAPVLVLRAFFPLHPALEFRCFVRHRCLLAISARDLNHYPFLRRLRPAIVARVRELFDRRLRFTFPEGSFVFDVYIPDASGEDGAEDGLGRARLIDINPWAPRTDALLFGWQELLAVRVARPVLGSVDDADHAGRDAAAVAQETAEETTDDDVEEDDEEDEEYTPELRLVEEHDPAAYNFSSPQYSAHKLPKEVVDASLAGHTGMRDFAERWQRIMAGAGTAQDWEVSDEGDK